MLHSVASCMVCLFMNIIIDTSALLCWKCDVRDGERECTQQGETEECHDDQVCVTVIRIRNDQVMLTRNCKQKQACEGMTANNQGSCDIQRYHREESICYHCCKDQDYCNAPHNDPHFHLKSTSFSSLPNLPPTHVLPSAAPPITSPSPIASRCDDDEICGVLFIVEPDYFDESNAN